MEVEGYVGRHADDIRCRRGPLTVKSLAGRWLGLRITEIDRELRLAQCQQQYVNRWYWSQYHREEVVVQSYSCCADKKVNTSSACSKNLPWGKQKFAVCEALGVSSGWGTGERHIRLAG